jgi:hypothetical protein
MTYAGDDEDEFGGQIIIVNKYLKKLISKSCNLSYIRVEQALTDFVRAGYFRRVDVGTYQVNPNFFGKGEWRDIEKIKATFNFNNGEVVAEIIKSEEESMTKNQEALAELYEKAEEMFGDKEEIAKPKDQEQTENQGETK